MLPLPLPLPADELGAATAVAGWARRQLPALGTDAMTLVAALVKRAQAEGGGAMLAAFAEEAMGRALRGKNPSGLFLTIVAHGIKRKRART